MSFSPIALTIPNYRDFNGYFLKAFIAGSTTTPKVMATDATGVTTVDKFELDINGFPKTVGNALVIPFIDGFYDLWAFPTEAEADANDTSNALRFAINVISEDTAGAIDRLTPDELSTAIADDRLEDGDVLNVKERNLGNGGGAFWDVVLLSTVTLSVGQPSIGDVVAWGSNTGAATDLAIVLRIVDKTVDITQFGALVNDSNNDSAAVNLAFLSSALTITNNTGVSRVSGLSIPENTKLLGVNRDQTGFRRVTSTTEAMFIVRSTNTLQDLFFDGNASSAGSGDSLSIDGKINIDLIRVKLTRAANDGLLCRNSSKILCKDVVTSLNFRSGGAFTDNNTDVTIDGWDSKDDVVTGLDVEPNSTINSEFKINDVIVDGTTFSVFGQSASVINQDIQVNSIKARNSGIINISRVEDIQIGDIQIDANSTFRVDQFAVSGFSQTSGELGDVAWAGKPNSASNQVKNGSFESQITNWTKSETGSATVNIIESEFSLFGGRTLSVSATAPDSALLIADDIIVGSEEVVSIGCYIKASLGRPYMEVQFRDASNVELETYRISDKVIADNRMRNHFIVVETPITTAKVKLFVGGNTTVSSGDLAGEFDGIYVYRKVVKARFDFPRLSRDITFSGDLPTNGFYFAGDIVWNTSIVVDVNSMHILGWRRITTGAGHVLNTDWIEMNVSTVSPAI